ncbi:MAG: glycosyltransferase [Chitinispirillaceae bacterium]|nr:glycosyltransferase [Chitinispirillaceae bacterium]
MLPHPDISLVMPMHNEADNIGPLLREIFAVFEMTVKKNYEIIIVDDASGDESIAMVEQEKNRYFTDQKPVYLSEIALLRQPVRSGQFKALIRGISKAGGDCIITMDSDLQQDPADIPGLLRMMEACDMVCGVRATRYDGMARRICSKIANGFRTMITGDSTVDSGCMFRVMRAACVAAIVPCDGRLFGCEGLFFPLLVRRKGFRVSEAPVTQRRRGNGKSRYHLVRGRLLSGIAACLKVRFGGLAR